MVGSITPDDVKKYVLAMLGSSHITVELTEGDDTKDWPQILKRTIKRYNYYRPKIIELPFQVLSGTQEYRLDAAKVGRGVFDIVRRQDIGDTYFALFDSSYFPLNFGGYRLDTPHFLEWKVWHQGQREVYGVTFDFEYNPDNNILTIYPPPTESESASLVTGHNRLWEQQQIGEGDGLLTSFGLAVVDEDGFQSLPPLVPGIRIRTKNEIFRDKQDGTFESNLGGDGTIDYVSGDILLNFNTAPAQGDPILIDLFEVRPHDGEWFQDYALALAKIVVGHKRARFGSIPGQQASIELDTAVRDHGSEALKELEDTAKLWMLQYLIPRQQ